MLLDTVIRSLAGRPTTSQQANNETNNESNKQSTTCKVSLFQSDHRYPHAAHCLFIHTVNELIESSHTDRVIVWSLRDTAAKLNQSITPSNNKSKLVVIDSVSQLFTAKPNNTSPFISIDQSNYVTPSVSLSNLPALVPALQHLINQSTSQSPASPSAESNSQSNKAVVLCIDGLSSFLLHNHTNNPSINLIHFLQKLTSLRANDQPVHLSIHIDQPTMDQLSAEHLNALNRLANTIITCESVRLVARPVSQSTPTNNQSNNQSINLDRVLTIHISHNRRGEKRTEKFEQWLVQPDERLTGYETNNQSNNQTVDRMDAAINSLIDQPDVQSTFNLGMSHRQRSIKQAIAIAQEQRSDAAISLTSSGLSINQSINQVNSDSLIEADDLLDDDEEDPDDDLDI